jgi:hypothetical protein
MLLKRKTSGRNAVDGISRRRAAQNGICGRFLKKDL